MFESIEKQPQSNEQQETRVVAGEGQVTSRVRWVCASVCLNPEKLHLLVTAQCQRPPTRHREHGQSNEGVTLSLKNLQTVWCSAGGGGLRGRSL